MPGSPPLRLVVGSRDITEQHRQLVYSNVDPGGLEALTCAPRDPTVFRPGDPVRLTCGLETAWMGAVNDPGDKLDSGRGSGVLAALGPGMRLKQGEPAMFVHSDLTQWQNVRSHPDADLSTYKSAYDIQATDGQVAITWPANQATAGSGLAFLDLGPMLTARRIVITYYSSAAAANNALYILAGDSLSGIGADNSALGALAAGGPFTAAFTFTAPRRYIGLRLDLNGHTPAADEWVKFTSIQVFADPTYESGNTSVLNPAMVARYAFAQAGGITPGDIGDVSSFPIQHLLYSTPAPYETMVDDGARLMGWHWGVWEPASMLGDQRPRGFFKQAPAHATGMVGWADCTGGEAPRVRADLLYDTCRCQYQTVDGKVAFASASRENPMLPASLAPRTLDVNMGVGTASSAALFAGFALALSQRAARGGGWAALPPTVHTPAGPKPSCLLKSGRDRLRLIGLPDTGNLLEADTRRYDTFHLKRVEVAVDDHGVPRTRVEFDGGGDLMEVLNARLAQPAARTPQLVGAT